MRSTRTTVFPSGLINSCLHISWQRCHYLTEIISSSHYHWRPFQLATQFCHLALFSSPRGVRCCWLVQGPIWELVLFPAWYVDCFPNPEALTPQQQPEGHPDEARNMQHGPVLPAALSASFYFSHSGALDMANEPSVAWKTYIQNQAEIK